jgi:two-component system chemotaxis response regulator CheY
MTAAATTTARVLVIDDDEIVLETVKALLEGAGYHVHCLASPIGATQVIVSQQINVVVVDLNMPVMQGDRFISLLRSWDKIRDVPTILLSSASPATLHAVAKELPGVATVSKTTMHRTLPETLQRVLSRARGVAPAAPGKPPASPDGSPAGPLGSKTLAGADPNRAGAARRK